MDQVTTPKQPNPPSNPQAKRLRDARRSLRTAFSARLFIHSLQFWACACASLFGPQYKQRLVSFYGTSRSGHGLHVHLLSLSFLDSSTQYVWTVTGNSSELFSCLIYCMLKLSLTTTTTQPYSILTATILTTAQRFSRCNSQLFYGITRTTCVPLLYHHLDKLCSGIEKALKLLEESISPIHVDPLCPHGQSYCPTMR